MFTPCEPENYRRQSSMEICCDQRIADSDDDASKVKNASANPKVNQSAKDDLRVMGYAYHEAGHAVANHHFGRTLVRVAIINSGKKGSGGVTVSQGQHQMILEQRGVFWEGTPERWRYLSDHIVMRSAGEVAQMLYCPDSIEPHHSAYDRIAVGHLMKQLLGYAYERDRQEKLEELLQETRDLLTNRQCAAAVHALAQALIEQKDISGGKATDIIVAAKESHLD